MSDNYRLPARFPEPVLPWESILLGIAQLINKDRPKLLQLLREQVAVREAQVAAMNKAIERLENADNDRA